MANEPIQRNASSAKAVKDASKTQKQQEAEDREELRVLSQDPKFRRFVWRVLGFCGMHKHGFDETSPHKTAFNLGARNVGLFIQGQIVEARPETLLQMMTESRINEKD